MPRRVCNPDSRSGEMTPPVLQMRKGMPISVPEDTPGISQARNGRSDPNGDNLLEPRKTVGASSQILGQLLG